MSKRKFAGTGFGKGHGGNSANLPIIREYEPKSALARYGLEPDARFFRAAKLSIILGRHPDTQAWHISIAHPDRYPTWDELAYIRYALIPDDVFMVMALPSRKDYVNIHNFCFQMHEIPFDVWNGVNGYDGSRGMLVAQLPSGEIVPLGEVKK